MIKKIFYVFLIIFLIIGSIAAYTFFTTINQAETAVQSVGDFVQQLVVPATPVILPDSTLIVNQINDLARLETASVDLEKVITAERGSDALFGTFSESMIFVANGTVVAGIDFQEMEEADLKVVDPETIWVHLPNAKIFEDLPVLDNEESYVADRDTGLFVSADPELETEVRRVAESTIREEAFETGIVSVADENAEAFMESFLTSLGFTNVVFYDETPPDPPEFVQDVPKGQVLATPQP
ncbi:MAG: DUF4230 domain-containing protein [Chloroflexota bacterium]